MMKNKYLITCLVASALLLTGCNRLPYKIDVNQGNVISRADLEQLSLGMTKEEVQMTIGRSLLNDIFHRNRWDYVQYYKSGKTQKVQEGLVSLYFTNGLLSRVNDEKVTDINEEPLSYGTLVKEKAIDVEEIMIEKNLIKEKPSIPPSQPQ